MLCAIDRVKNWSWAGKIGENRCAIDCLIIDGLEVVPVKQRLEAQLPLGQPHDPHFVPNLTALLVDAQPLEALK